MLNPQQQIRYSRHLVLPEVGEQGQLKLQQASVLLVGLGGLGSPLALYLAAAGVGRLGLVEFDRVTESNLQRQVLYGTEDVDRPKVEVAAERLRDLNPHVILELHSIKTTAADIAGLVEQYDLVADGSDNFSTRYLVNDACLQAGKPDVWGAVHRFEGQVAVWGLGDGPCYRCLFPEPPPAGMVDSCADAGVLGVVPGVIGSLQGVEVLKVLLGIGEPLSGRLLIFDALGASFREVTVPRDPECPACSRRGEIELVDLSDHCPADPEAGSADELADQHPDELEGSLSFDISPHELSARFDAGEAIRLLDVRSAFEQRFRGLSGALAMPLEELPQRAEELDRDADWVIYCHLGIRSAQAVRYLHQLGFRRARNLTGGTDAWSVEVDPTLPRY